MNGYSRYRLSPYKMPVSSRRSAPDVPAPVNESPSLLREKRVQLHRRVAVRGVRAATGATKTQML